MGHPLASELSGRIGYADHPTREGRYWATPPVVFDGHASIWLSRCFAASRTGAARSTDCEQWREVPIQVEHGPRSGVIGVVRAVGGGVLTAW